MAEPVDPFERLEKIKKDIKEGVERILAMTPEEQRQMRDQYRGADEAGAFAEEMVPEGQFDEEETRRRREVWTLWVLMPQGGKFGVHENFGVHQHRDVFVDALAQKMGMPVEWVRGVLNLPPG